MNYIDATQTRTQVIDQQRQEIARLRRQVDSFWNLLTQINGCQAIEEARRIVNRRLVEDE